VYTHCALIIFAVQLLLVKLTEMDEKRGEQLTDVTAAVAYKLIKERKEGLPVGQPLWDGCPLKLVSVSYHGKQRDILKVEYKADVVAQAYVTAVDADEHSKPVQLRTLIPGKGTLLAFTSAVNRQEAKVCGGQFGHCVASCQRCASAGANWQLYVSVCVLIWLLGWCLLHRRRRCRRRRSSSR
jgi:hypothetical protein